MNASNYLNFEIKAEPGAISNSPQHSNVDPNEESSDINLKLIGPDDFVMYVTTKPSIPFLEIKEEYARQRNDSISELCFLFDGTTINNDETPVLHGLRDGSEISVLRKKRGGSERKAYYKLKNCDINGGLNTYHFEIGTVFPYNHTTTVEEGPEYDARIIKIFYREPNFYQRYINSDSGHQDPAPGPSGYGNPPCQQHHHASGYGANYQHRSNENTNVNVSQCRRGIITRNVRGARRGHYMIKNCDGSGGLTTYYFEIGTVFPYNHITTVEEGPEYDTKIIKIFYREPNFYQRYIISDSGHQDPASGPSGYGNPPCQQHHHASGYGANYQHRSNENTNIDLPGGRLNQRSGANCKYYWA
ncbi:uncharacterized protein LOC141852173 [Brevipalpus obovatus]|uniref:uncharacterized protein LOC141852173 n=1 Tax=Brevipalpus obovatus TaxID=246614 RepID=UPI003D9DE173